MKKSIFMIILSVISLLTYAEGYQVNVQSQKNTAMGHTGTALLLGSSSVHFNPGALSLMDKDYDFSFGGTLVYSQASYAKSNSDYQATTDNPVGTPFYLYGAKKIGEKSVISIGVTTPYGNSLAWDDDWSGRYLIQNISLKAIVVQPTYSYKISDKLGVGLGAMLVFGSVNLNKALPIESAQGEGSAELDGSTTSFGFNAGIYYQASEALSFGLNYRSKVKMEMVNGDASFETPSALAAYFPADNTFDAELPLPANLTFGLGYHLNEKWTLAADFQYVFWSAYEELVFDFEKNTDLLADSYNPRGYENTLIYRIGAEFNQSDKLALRAGAYYDQTPISDILLNPETPGMNKIGLSFGGTYMLSEKLALDVSLLYIKGLEREASYSPANFSGTYNTTAVLPGLGLSYAF